MEVVDTALVLLPVPDQRCSGGKGGVADAVGYIKIIMVHLVGRGTAGEVGEIPSAQHTDVVCRSGRRMRRVLGNTGRNKVGLLPPGELFVGNKNVQHARAIARVQWRGRPVRPIGGLDGAIQ